MRIINQRRSHSVNFDNIEIRIEDSQIIAIGSGKMILGNYRTEKRALEVFEEIHKVYTGYLEIEEEMKKIKDFDIDKMPKFEGGFIQPVEPRPTVILPRNSVYEMPIS